MNGDTVKIIIDGVEVDVPAEQTILRAAEAAGIYIPRLCYHPDLEPGGHCRVCTVKVDGRPTYSCGTPVQAGMVIENDTEELNAHRRRIIEMLFVEGNHFCPFCEASGRCELQALGYRLGMTGSRFRYQYPERELDTSQPGVMVDRNRCILCGRCVRASRDVDGKRVFGFERRGIEQRLAVDSPRGAGSTALQADDKAAQVCPVGCIELQEEAFKMPYGQRRYDKAPIGADIEQSRPGAGGER